MLIEEPLEESAPNPFICDCEEYVRPACASEGFYKEKEGKRYCVLHYPGDEKVADFQTALNNKLAARDYDFGGVWFPENVSFDGVQFSGDAIFLIATFSAEANFSGATFSEGAQFMKATFRERTIFANATFSSVADFRNAVFDAVASFYRSTFKDYAYFAGSSEKRTLGDYPQIYLGYTHLEKPDRFLFHTLDLKPHWFVNADSRKFAFTNVEYNYKLKDELESLKKIGEDAAHRLLAIACRQLADNAETNHRYHEASRLRYSSFDARRIERFYGLSFWRIDWWYWLASGYSERVLQAFIVFVVLIGLFTIGYKNADFDPTSKTAITKPMPVATSSSPDTQDTQPRRLGWREAALYSFNVSILQKPEPKPKGLLGNALVSLETVLGPAQAALLALALRRRFMR